MLLTIFPAPQKPVAVAVCDLSFGLSARSLDLHPVLKNDGRRGICLLLNLSQKALDWASCCA